MKTLLFANLGWKLLSLLLAFLLWIAVAQDTELATSISVPILFRNIPPDLELSSDVIDRAHLEIRGPSSRLTATSLAQVAVVFNLVTVQPGERTFTIRNTSVMGLPLGVSFYRAVPSQVSMRFEHQISKEVVVEPTFEKPPAPGYAVSAYHFRPSTVKIRGPEARVRDIDHVTTDPIDLTQIRPNTVLRMHVRLPDPQLRLESTAVVMFTATIEKVTKKELK